MAPAAQARREASIAIIGVGPYGLSVLERLTANASLLDARPLRVHLIDPYLASGGRVWRNDQPSRLWMNTVARAITLFTDETVRCEGPVVPGPTLYEWAATAGRELSRDESLGDIVGRNSPLRWSSRSVMGDYLRFVLDEVIRRPVSGLSIRHHSTVAVDVREFRDGAGRPVEHVWLQDVDEPLVCDRVIFAQGNADVALTPQQGETRRQIVASGGCYVAPGMVSWQDVEDIAPGEPVMVRGLGLTFFDYLQILTVGRQGAFHRDQRGVLRYRPSGKEPMILATSRRGVTFRPSPWPPISRPNKCTLPRFLTAEAFREAIRGTDPESAFALTKQLAEHDIRYAYYAELFDGHPDRVAMSWQEFSERFLTLPCGAPERERLIEAAVPAASDRFDLDGVVDPLARESFDSMAQLQSWMRSYIARSANRATHAGFSADRTVLDSIASIVNLVEGAARQGVTPHGREVVRLTRQWTGRCAVAMGHTGAPWPRQEELIALSRAGIVTFLGPRPAVRFDEPSCSVYYQSKVVRGAPEFQFSSVIEARLPAPAVGRSGDPLVRRLHGRGEFVVSTARQSRADRRDGSGRLLVAPSGRVARADGGTSETRFAIGSMVASSLPLILPRPLTNSLFLRGTDRLAREVLRSLAPCDEGAAAPRREARDS